jgi:hypothetical protein
MFVLCSQALPERFFEMQSGAERQDARSLPMSAARHPALCFLVTPV